MSSNVVKFNRVVVAEEEKRVIDTNALMEEKLKKFEAIIKQAKPNEVLDGFSEGLDVQHVELLLSDETNSAEIGEVIQQGVADVEALRQEMLEEIEELKQTAIGEAHAMKQQIMEEARNEGYREGYEQGSSEAAAQLADLEKQLQKTKSSLIQEYNEKMETVEPMLVETLTGIYEHIFHVCLEDFKENILYLVQHTIHETEGCRDFIVHVSKADYTFVLENKAQLMEKMITNATIEIIEDALVPASGCIIETESGILDCGMDTQLKELGKQLRILSYGKM